MKGDVRRLQDDVAGQAARQEAQLRELSADIQALQDSLEIQSAIQSEMVVDTRGGIARELRDIQTQLSQLTELTGQIQRSVVKSYVPTGCLVLSDGPCTVGGAWGRRRRRSWHWSIRQCSQTSRCVGT